VKVLIISASMGAGHDGAARELRRRLERDGHEARVVDFLTAFPLGTGRLVRSSYELELRFAPAAYELTYRLWYLLPAMAAPLMWVLSLLTDRRVGRWVTETRADAVVSTYPLASLALGRARRKGRLTVPASTFITDFSVHPLWAARGIDLHLAVHPRSAASAHAQTGAPAVAPGPLVPETFTDALPSRSAARAELGIAADERVALLVAGSWGIGAVRRTFDDIVTTGWMPLAVCGRNDRLREHLETRGKGIVFGWTTEMPTLMAAADVLVENAGGLTCMEAFAAGLPVVTYRPIAGHGRGNAVDMQAAGVAALAQPGKLGPALDDAVGLAGRNRSEAGRAMFAGDAAAEITELAYRGVGPVAGTVAAGRRRSRLRPAMVGVAAFISLALGLGATTLGAGIAAATGVVVAHPPHHATAIYLGLRLGPSAADNAQLPTALADIHVTAIVSGQLAVEQPAFVAGLAEAGVDVANGGWGTHRGYLWSRTQADVSRSEDAIRDATGGKVVTFAPDRSVDGFELASARWEDQRVVLTHEVVPTSGELPLMHPGGVYVLDARGLTNAELVTLLGQIGGLQSDGQQIAPLSGLRG
jgi:processive 1,2-diacylglycerol beta-glucosyltransferase